ncbi:MAG: hypothetical protein GY705_26775 [Bacteroidetes bacterium]|nr:hypothetical protein [Bacteroidota bacterium]
MSWDGLIFNGKDIPESIDGVPENWKPHPIGNPTEVIAALKRAAEDATLTSDGYFVIDGKQFSIELRIDIDDKIIDSIGVRIVGDGKPMDVIIDICQKNHWVLFDNQSGDLINLNQPHQTFEKYTSWRDKTS